MESLRINFGEVLIEINTFSFKKIHLQMSSAKWPFSTGNAFCCNSISGIAYIAVILCAKSCSDGLIKIWMKTKWKTCHIWIVKEKLFVKWVNMVKLTHWGRGKMAAIFQMAFSNALSWMKMCKFWLIFHWSLFPRVQLTIFQHFFR